MVPYINYETAHICVPMASMATVRLLIGFKAKLGLHMEHFEITATYVHEAFGYKSSFFVKEMRRSDGSYLHGRMVGLLRGNMFGGKSSRIYFLKGLMANLKNHRYSPTDFHPCLYFKLVGTAFVLFSA